MFNDRYGLTQAVLDGRKTMTRRIIKGNFENVVYLGYNGAWYGRNLDLECLYLPQPQYEIGEEVAIAQSYHTLNKSGFLAPEWLDHTCEDSSGYVNKMFVRADLMPHRIRITDVQAQMLREISGEDCIKEGIIKGEFTNTWGMYYYDKCGNEKSHIIYFSPRSAYAALIDRICGKCTWERNPLVYAYSFELIK